MVGAGPIRIDERDPRYPALVRGFNQRWVGRPRRVEVCRTTTDVVASVERALQDGLRITVRSGGHCYEDFVSGNDGGVILDLSPLSAVYLDAATGQYCVEAGATLWNAYGRLYKEHGVTLPGGSCYSVGAGGHVIGGGYGLLSRLHGLTVDYLDAVELVHVAPDGGAELITVSRDAGDRAQRELLWAHLGGGGGNFGVVTRFWFRELPPAPSEAHLLNHAWNWSDIDQDAFGSLVAAYGAFFEANSEPGSPYAGLFALLHLTQNSGPTAQIVLTAQYVGRDPSLLDAFAREVGAELAPPTAQIAPVGYHHLIAQAPGTQRMPWLFATQRLNGSGAPQRGKYKSAYMTRAFPQDQVETMWAFLAAPREGVTQALLQVDSYGCQINAVAPAASAVPQRSSIMKLQYQAYWSDPSGDEPNLGWIREFYTRMYGPRGPWPDDVLDGCYVNYPDSDLADWEHLYYKDAYPRLQAVKARWDPGNVFHHDQSVRAPEH
jgi:FAD/FMN-containing dehydrogenase